MLELPKPLMQAAPTPSVDPALFRRAMRLQAGAVAVVTVTGEGEKTGFTATSVTSLSADPPRLLVCVNRSASSYPALLREGRFAVNLLGADQQGVAERFAGIGGVKGASRYEGARWRRLPGGTLGLEEALVVLDCAVEEIVERHSHAIVIADVLGAVLGNGADALVYWQGRYRILPDLAEAKAPAPTTISGPRVPDPD
jgi:flavin reductase (DIM6/NTAB) family NADH-FMN oxidoreductase RutF